MRQHQQINEMGCQIHGNSGGACKARSESEALFTRRSRYRYQPGAALAVLMGFIVCARGDAIIDFRNYIEGVLDARVYDVDGVTKLQGNQFYAQVYVAPGREGPFRAPVTPPSPFLTGANAGYWWPQEVTFPDVAPGQQIWVLVQVFETLPGFEIQPRVLWGVSKPFSIVLRDTPTPLVGLESFSLGPQWFGFERRGGDLVVRWLNQVNATYSLESTTDLAAAGSWKEVWRGSGVYPGSDLISVTNAIVGEQRFFRLKMWR